MTVRELIETLEGLPMDLPVIENGSEISEVLVRNEEYFSSDYEYKEGLIVKIY